MVSNRLIKIEHLMLLAEKHKLAGREVLRRFSVSELAEIYNGIGPDRMPELIRNKITDCNALFEPAALIHDVEYWIGGTRTEFELSNERFRKNCHTLVKTEYTWYDWERYRYLWRANRYAGYCDRYGLAGWNKDGLYEDGFYLEAWQKPGFDAKKKDGE